MFLFRGMSAQSVFVAEEEGETEWLYAVADENKSKSLCDSAALMAESERMLSVFYKKGHLSAAYRVVRADSCFSSVWKIGRVFRWAVLKKGNMPDILLSATGYRQKLFVGTPFSPRGLVKMLDKIIEVSDNEGYPFAAVQLDSVKIEAGRVGAVLRYRSGPYITFDELALSGTDKVKSGWLSSFLRIKEGQKFSQRSVDEIPAKLERLPFIIVKNMPTVTFQNAMARVEIKVEYVDANRIDGIVGFLPNEQEEGKLLVTGQAVIRLKNLFSSGKSLDMEWKSMKPRSQLLDISYVHPNIGKTAVGAFADFYLLKEDTVFLNRESFLGASFDKKKVTISLLYRFNSSANLSRSGDEDVSDSEVGSYGLRLQYHGLRPGVQSGRAAEITATIGAKKLSPDDAADRGIEIRSTQYMVNAGVDNRQRLTKNIAVFNRILAGKLFNDFIFRNDMYRLGGLGSVRGFNENAFFASEYVLAQTELQLYFQARSYFYLFFDQSYIGFRSLGVSGSDYPYGFGIGIALHLPKGILSVVYALGKSADQPLDTRLSKFHFGYVLKF